MGRLKNPLYRHPQSGVYFARWYKEDGLRVMLSLGTKDPIEAMKRLPAVQTSRRSWPDLVGKFVKEPTVTIKGFGCPSHNFVPPIEMPASQEATISLLQRAAANGSASYDEKTGEWVILADTDNPIAFAKENLTQAPLKNDFPEIQEFFTVAVTNMYKDKPAAIRNAAIWLRFLKQAHISSWSQIDDKLILAFQEWRKATPIERAEGESDGTRRASAPSILVVNRHLKYLKRSFSEARERGFLPMNPLRNWAYENHEAKETGALTPAELHEFLLDKRLQTKSMIILNREVNLSFRLLDIFTILFASCKRRGEIIGLRIEDVNFQEHHVSYTEEKNKSKGPSYPVRKAFWLTSAMEDCLRRVIGERRTGWVFPCMDRPITPQFISRLFDKIVEKVAPKKKDILSLHNLRHTATSIMESEGLSDNEIDAVLGHYNVRTALPHYQDRSPLAVARRLAARTRKGIEVLSRNIEEFLTPTDCQLDAKK